MPCTAVVGGFFGDEGKGKIISYLAIADSIAVAARGGVGPNAAHTVVFENREYRLRMVPSAFVNPRTRLLIGAGVLIDVDMLLKEIELTGTRGRIGVDYQCGVIEAKHRDLDRKSSHLRGKVGTTGTGCGPANADRALRVLRLARDIPALQPLLTDVAGEVNEAIDAGKPVLLEGTQGTFLSLYHGTYPYVTSKDTTVSALLSDIGVGSKKVDDIIVVFKSYVTRVGGGPLEEEISEEEAKRRGWFEIAAGTGRKRRAAPFSFKLAKRAVLLNTPTQVALTKIDILFPAARGATSFEQLPPEAKQFVERIENELKVPVTLIGTGPGASEIIDRRRELGLL